MRMKMRQAGLIAMIAAMFAFGQAFGLMPLRAEQAEARVHLHLDPAATEVHFTLKDTLHTVHGTFHLTAGEIRFDAKTGEAQGKIDVDAGSGVSGNDTRDGRMKKEYLESPKFPLASFEPQKVSGFDPGAASQTIQVAGIFTVHGGTHPMTLQFTVERSGEQATAKTHFIIPYVDWGIKNPSIPFVHVEKEVTMDIVAKGTLGAEK